MESNFWGYKSKLHKKRRSLKIQKRSKKKTIKCRVFKLNILFALYIHISIYVVDWFVFIFYINEHTTNIHLFIYFRYIFCDIVSFEQT